MINWSIMTWPSTKRMTIVAIETVSRALNATLSEKDFANVTAAVLSAQVANKLAGNLAQLTLDRVFPNTDQLDSAATGVIDLIKNCLDVFQTILTPNLPQDPTVDEMRNYLEYIKVFKSVDGSREALPDLTVALTQLTEYLTHLTQMGDPENKMENDYVYISSEMLPANEIKAAGDVHRPRVTIELGEITPTNPGPCSASTVILKTIIFKHNPYFWGQFADRITSYVPVFQMAGAVLATERVVYRLENKEEALCRDATPTYDQNDPDKMIYILFDRQHAEDDILIFLRPNASQLVYDLYFNKEEKPDMHENKYFYTTEMKVDKWTPEDGYKLIIKSSEFSATGKIWIGLRPLLENSGDVSLLTKPFCANITSVNCLAWVHHNGEDIWDKNKCEVSASSTRTHTVCDCENTMNTAGAEPMTVGTTFYVPYNKIDFKSEQTTALPIGRGPVIAIAVAVSVMYALLIFWAWREDQKDQYKWSYSLLIDNDIADSSFYIIRVYTGLRSGSGTDSKIGFVLGFEQGSVRTFVMSTRRYIGDLLCMRIWHDDTGGNNSSWFLNKIVISDLRSGKRCTFACDQWFDYDTGDTKVDRVLNAQPANQFWSFMEMVSYTIAEHHLWLSVYTRPMKSNFTRVQRLSCLLGLIFLTMIAVTMTLQSPDENIYQIVIGPFRFAFENFLVALVALLISTTVIMIVTFFFKNAESDESARFQSTLLNAYRKANSKIQFDKSVIGRIFVPPAEEALQYNYYFLPHFCVYVGWTILAMAIAVASYFIYSFSDSWELIKSEYWMSTIFVSFFCSIMVTEVIKVIFFALLYLMLCPRAYEAPDPFINKDNLEEITKHNSATLTIGPHLKTYTKWLNETFVDNYFSKSYYGAAPDGQTIAKVKPYMEDLTNLRVGPARLRQVRIQSESCIGPLRGTKPCHGIYNEKEKETTNYCLKWKSLPCPVAEKSEYFTSPAWLFNSSDEVWGFSTIAKYNTYGGGGYFMKLDVNSDVSVKIFTELIDNNWFDDKTRAVILEFSVYNANSNLFAYSKYVAEFPEVGGFIPFVEVYVFRLYLNTGPDGDFVLFLQFIFVLLVVFATLNMLYDVSTDTRAFLRSVWNYLDILALVMSYVTIGIYIYKAGIIKKTIEIFENDKNAYVGFENLAFYDFIANTAYGILVFLLSIRVSRILGYSGKINEMAAVIVNAADDLLGFLIIFGIATCAYVIWGTMLFGSAEEKYSSYFKSYGTLTEAIIGKNRIANILVSKPIYAELYYFSFVIFVLFTLSTMAAAILNFSITHVKEEQEKIAPTNIVEVLWDRVMVLVNKIKGVRKNYADKRKLTERRDSDDEIRAILSDLRLFMRGVQNKQRTEEKYKVPDSEDEVEIDRNA
ncbi:PKD2-like protein [Mya arenaria]|uniref:PKD2-like protein n=1 Tax=Mya arenaria TaxID=6604 RepID=A0ABY7DIB6_MYAAR|nr:PKD2-like protein [Mya arenaria]